MRPPRVKNDILRVLLEEGQLTELELASHAKASAAATRHSMDQLREARMLTKVKQRNRFGRIALHYGLTAKGIAEALKAEANLTLTGENDD
jgi:predicted ArsR family transcriptional regulator